MNKGGDLIKEYLRVEDLVHENDEEECGVVIKEVALVEIIDTNSGPKDEIIGHENYRV